MTPLIAEILDDSIKKDIEELGKNINLTITMAIDKFINPKDEELYEEPNDKDGNKILLKWKDWEERAKIKSIDENGEQVQGSGGRLMTRFEALIYLKA